jgi:hypothetical protein
MHMQAYRGGRRYDTWYALLQEEIDLLASPTAEIVAVGTAVHQNLMSRGFRRQITPILHYSSQAARWRAEAMVGREDGFEAFRGSVVLEDLVDIAEAVFTEARAPALFRDATLARMRRGELTPSRQQLIFHYKLKFESIRLAGSILSLAVTQSHD